MKKTPVKRRPPRSDQSKPEELTAPVAEETVDVKHNLTFIETIPKSQAPTIPLDAVEDEEDFDPDDVYLFEDEQEERKTKRKLSPTIVEQLQAKLRRAKIGTEEQLQMRIDRLPFYNMNGFSGVKADGDYLGKMFCTMDFITSEEYLDMISQRFGPGTYRLTLRYKNRNVSIWTESIGAPFASTTDEAGSSPNPVYPVNGPVASPPSIKKQMAEIAEMAAFIDQIRGKQPASAPEPPPVSKEIQFASVLLSDPEVRSKAIGGLRSLMGDSSPETSNTELLLKYADPIIGAFDKLVNSVVNGIHAVRQPPPPPNRQMFAPDQVENPQEGEQPPEAIEQTEITAQSAEDVLLNRLLEGLEKKFPPELIADRLNSIADRVFQASPDQSVYTWLDMFCRYDPAAILGMASLINDRAQAAAKLPHAEQWIKETQDFLKASQPPKENQEEENDNAQ